MQPHTPATSTAEPSDLPLLARMPTVRRMTGLGRSTIYRMIAEDRFPAQVRIGTRAVGWRWSDLERWCAGRPPVTH